MDDRGRLNNDGHGLLFSRRAPLPFGLTGPHCAPPVRDLMMIMVIPISFGVAAIKSRWKIVIEFFHDDLHTVVVGQKKKENKGRA